MMTDQHQQMAFLREHPINSRWNLGPDGSRRWTVTAFYAVGRGPSFEAALDDLIKRHTAAVTRLSGWKGVPS